MNDNLVDFTKKDVALLDVTTMQSPDGYREYRLIMYEVDQKVFVDRLDELPDHLVVQSESIKQKCARLCDDTYRRLEDYKGMLEWQ